MATHSSTLAWKIPWTEESGRLLSMRWLRVGHDWVTTFTFYFHALEKEMATHSSVLAWRIPGTGEPDGLPSMGLHRAGHDWYDLAAAAESLLAISLVCKVHKSSMILSRELKPLPFRVQFLLPFLFCFSWSPLLPYFITVAAFGAPVVLLHTLCWP